MAMFFLAVSPLLVLARLEFASGYKPDAICGANLALKATDPLVFYEIIKPEDKTADVQAKANTAQQKTPERKGRVIVGKRTIELTNQYGTKPLAEWKEQCREVPVIFVVSCDPKPVFHFCIPVCPAKNGNHVEAAVEALKTSAKTEATSKTADGTLKWSCNEQEYQILCNDVGETLVTRLTNDEKCKVKKGLF